MRREGIIQVLQTKKYETCRLIKSFRLWDTNKYETFSTCSANLLTSEKSFRLKEKIFGLIHFYKLVFSCF